MFWNFFFGSPLVAFIFVVGVSGDLYNSSDPVVILHAGNFNKEVLNVPNAWIIEFYNTWCGHCVHFAPIWREFAKNIKEWDHTIKIGVFDCSDDENTPLCRQYEVMAYPSVRIFGPHSNKEQKGENVKNTYMQDAIVDFIAKKEEEPTVEIPDSWVTVSKYKGLIKDVFNYAPPSAKHAVIIVQKPDSKVAQQVIMDLGHYSMVFVRWMEAGVGEVKDLISLPSVLVVDRNGGRLTLSKEGTTREELTALIIKELKLQQQAALSKTLKPNSGSNRNDLNPFESVEGAGDGVTPSKQQVYSVDIENALSYALNHEVVLHKNIEGDGLHALNNFLSAILRWLPLRPPVYRAIERLKNYLNTKISAKGEDFANEIKEINKGSHNTFLPSVKSWMGCKGSQPHLRGFPCGLWTLFHTLSVNAFLRQGSDVSFKPLEAIEAIHGYVKFFFSCENCSKHFQEMFALDAVEQIVHPTDGLMWLWAGHNKVNLRTKGSLSEDPTHPKVQFPSKYQCTSCRTSDNQFDRIKIIEFLKNFYGPSSLSMKGIEVPRKKGKDIPKVYPFVSISQNGIYPSKKAVTSYDLKKTWGFNTTDVSLCVAIYIFSTLLIVSGYFLFALKRKMRRRKYIQAYSAA